MNDKEFLDYCNAHSQTQRHMFTVHDVRRLLTLADESPESHTALKGLPDNHIIGMDVDFVRPRYEKAKARLVPPPEPKLVDGINFEDAFAFASEQLVSLKAERNSDLRIVNAFRALLALRP
jgi:hypothetical protein